MRRRRVWLGLGDPVRKQPGSRTLEGQRGQDELGNLELTCTSLAKFISKFSLTIPSLAAKKARTCETKWRSLSVSFSQSL